MPSISLPVLAIKEANDHLQALFIENQKLETQVDELSGIVKKTQEENETLNEYVRTANQRMVTLGQEHVEDMKRLRESLNSEMSDVRESLNSEMSDLRESLNIENRKKVSDLQNAHQKHLQKQEELSKAERGKLVNDLEVKSEENEKLVNDLEVKLEENKKLQQIIEEERDKVSVLENKIQKLNEYLVKNTSTRQEKVALLNNAFKSTIENMSRCLSVTSEQDFIRSDSLVFENYDIHGHEQESEAFSNSDIERSHSTNENNSGLGDKTDKIHNSDSGIQSIESDTQDNDKEDDLISDGKLGLHFYRGGNDIEIEKNELEGEIQVLPNTLQKNSDLQNYFASHNGDA